ncbi:hypothetical protein ABW20_dc0107361 [Dactylellina cionopaga]|nr:hypothetical protein ABW20_dc0107361 [Dactylellina cionopaga]
MYTPDGRRSYFFCVISDSTKPPSVTNGVYNGSQFDQPAFPGQELLCSLDANQVFSCHCTIAGISYTELIFNNFSEGVDHGIVYLATSGYPLAATQAAVTAQAVPFHWDDKCGYHEDPSGFGNDFDQDFVFTIIA